MALMCPSEITEAIANALKTIAPGLKQNELQQAAQFERMLAKRGLLVVKARRLMASVNAFHQQEHDEAYHQLRMTADRPHTILPRGMTGPVVIGNCELWLGDCRDIVPTLGKVDAVVTDPPYGKRERTLRKTNGRTFSSTSRLHGRASEARDWPAVHGDDRPFDPSPWLSFPKVVLFGANHFSSRLPDASHWIIWDKREETSPDDNADCEMAWTNLKGPARIHRQLWRGICRRGEEAVSPAKPRLHPTQKPIALMDFCLRACRLDRGATVLDPYMGAGATGVAAARLGLRFIGIEFEPQYFETACERIEAAYRQPDMLTATSAA